MPGLSRTARVWTVVVLGLVLVAAMICAAAMGYIRLSPSEVLDVVFYRLGGGGPLPPGMKQVLVSVVWDVRLPRIMAAVVVGAALAGAGVVFQAVLLNPLADPFTLGVSSGAGFGACLALVLGLDVLGPYVVCLAAFAGAVVSLLAVLRLSVVHGRMHPTSLILSGVIVAAILSAGISLMKYLAGEDVAVVVFWLMGSLVSKSWVDVGVVFAATAVGLGVCGFYTPELNILCLGERTAFSLGVDTTRVRMRLLISASLMSGACVAVAGIIGFVGLLVPHLLRMVVGPDHQLLLPASVLAGALLVLMADTCTRALLPHEVPVGVLTAVIGGPFFCFVFRRHQLGRLRHG